MKKLLNLIRVIVVIITCYFAFMFFKKEQFSIYIILGIIINYFLNVVDRLLREKKNWVIIFFDIVLVLVTTFIFVDITTKN